MFYHVLSFWSNKINIHIFKMDIKNQPTDILTWLKLKPATPCHSWSSFTPISRKPCLDSMCKGQTIRLNQGKSLWGLSFAVENEGVNLQLAGSNLQLCFIIFDFWWWSCFIIIDDFWCWCPTFSSGKGTESRHVIFGDFSLVVGMHRIHWWWGYCLQSQGEALGAAFVSKLLAEKKHVHTVRLPDTDFYGFSWSQLLQFHQLQRRKHLRFGKFLTSNHFSGQFDVPNSLSWTR